MCLHEVEEENVVSSRGKSVPRGVKRKMSSYPIRGSGSPVSAPKKWKLEIDRKRLK